MKATKEIRGITLIALVITIIVLLILAGVALATLTGNSSIIDNANYAVEEYNKSANEDQNVLNQVENLFAKYMGESSSTGDDDDDDDTIGNLATTVNVGDYITYNPTLGVTNQSLLSYTSPVGELKVKNGNTYLVNESGTDENAYVYNGLYNAIEADGEIVLTGYTIESDVSGNGYGAQSFTATANNNLWRVLETNTTTGVVKIVPETPIKTTENSWFYLRGFRGYKYGAAELNNISAIFGHGKKANGAKSIEIEKINELTGYSVGTPELIATYHNEKSWYHTEFYYRESDYPVANENIRSMIFSEKNYWAASPAIYMYSDGGYADFCEGGAGEGFNGGTVGFSVLWSVFFDDNNLVDGKPYEHVYPMLSYDSVMPVVTLKASANCLGGTGEQATPWQFQATE